MAERHPAKIATLRVARGGPLEERHWQDFEVPFEPGASILDGLMWIRVNRDSSLAFRYSCINANVCKECVMHIDGKARYACTERLREGLMTIGPLPNKKLVRDLACETVPPKERV